jgi:hypothetical protein
MCCDPIGTKDEIVDVCEHCGSDVDSDGWSNDICAYSAVICDSCGCAPCDDSC